MFQRLNNMFVGDACSDSNQEPEFSEKDEDEWVLVDFIVDACTKLSEESATCEEIVHVDETPVQSHVSNCFEWLGNTSDSYFVNFNPWPMEESWFVTPPPCFTAGELTTFEVETSPMENLLIEHPSMSVYAVHNLCHKPEAGCESEFLTSDILSMAKENEKKGQRIHCYVAALAARINCLEQNKMYCRDKISKRQFEKHLNRKSLRRQNLIRGCHSQQIKHSKLLVHQPCQRQYNY
ncbi:tumor protein p53-inducible nuclear protein 1 [Rhinophrynus dorsalis]